MYVGDEFYVDIGIVQFYFSFTRLENGILTYYLGKMFIAKAF